MPVKLVIAGGFGVGKTTTVASISEIVPLTTEALMTSASLATDDTAVVPDKTTTTVALDFGCITVDKTMKLYLFGTPGQDRFGFMWNDIARGALGALVIVDSRRLSDGYPAIDYFERLGMPFAVAVNRFDGSLSHDLTAIRWALAVHENVPVVTFDARDRQSVRDALLALLHRALTAARVRDAITQTP
ncbi:ATP/GTP-binding protein [Streptomyces sp. NBC_00102]|uniref:GTP-binding protein n=1 Tax=Streptomyces sp. NBC_00102 TaxID=2975652 RepID=UPI0022598703|nr:ATP/GTP-binding protein [Streptomyces sp. NBC_00102]MCX5400459.1 ATP/GTP-binding protein [Streptomyces sp. NBC_00102]